MHMEGQLKVSFVKSDIGTGHPNAVVVAPVFNGKKTTPTLTAYDKICGGQVRRSIQAIKFSGLETDSFQIIEPKGTNTTRLVVKGVGKPAEFDAEAFGARVAKEFLGSGEATLVLQLNGLNLKPEDAARAALGAVLASYRFDKYLTKLGDSKKAKLKAVKIAYDEPNAARSLYKNFYGPVSEGTKLARDLVSEPANKLYPKSYAAQIKKMEANGLKVEVLGEKRMKSLKMEALLGVGKGSARESQLVVMRWDGGKKSEKPICLVGKGVTFDTGGISIKPSANMWDMKGDMGGSAAVVGAMHIIAARKAKANVIGLVGLVENMPDGNAQNPGDIVTSMSGQTIEVRNTDAEGRLVLCDMLWYAKEKYKPKAMVDLATLTGAIMVALGPEYSGLFSNDDQLAKQLFVAGENSTEKLWRLPLAPAYDKMIESPVADMNNLGGKFAGSITAAQFLQRFVGDVPWAHLDIAGTAWKEGSSDPREPAWATGFGARLMNQWVADNYED